MPGWIWAVGMHWEGVGVTRQDLGGWGLGVRRLSGVIWGSGGCGLGGEEVIRWEWLSKFPCRYLDVRCGEMIEVLDFVRLLTGACNCYSTAVW